MNQRLEKHKILDIMKITEDISQLKDLDSMLDRVLSEARRFTRADAGSIYLAHDKVLTFDYVQNDSLMQKDPTSNRYLYSNEKVKINPHSIAGYVAQKKKPLIIDDVYHLGKGVPYRFNHKFDEKSSYRTKAVMTVPLITSQDKIIGVMQIINPQNRDGEIASFSMKDKLIVTYFANQAAVAIEKAIMTREIILRMIRMSELRDPLETGSHVNRVGAYAIEIYHKWALDQGIPETEIKKTKDILRIAAMLHDVGKIGVSDVILKKQGSLNETESHQMKMHTIYGARLFTDRTSDWDDMAAAIAFNHHERWDGTGYPGYIRDIHQNRITFSTGKKGEDIPLCARIVSLADVYDALMSERYYKCSWSEDRVIDYIENQRGGHFDPGVVDAFFSIYDVIRAIQEKFSFQMPNPID